MGIAMRTKNTLDLALPSIIWKQFACIRLDSSDLAAIDISCTKYIDTIRNIDKEGVAPESFNDVIFETFTIQTSSGQVVELKPGTQLLSENLLNANCRIALRCLGGKEIPVTWENRLEFCNLVEQYRLNEFKVLCQ